jgi:hypothetical protein
VKLGVLPAAFAVAALGLPAGGTAHAGAKALPSLSVPVRAAFYYGWFPEGWSADGNFPHYRPSLGYYNSSTLTVIRRHIKAMLYGGIQAGIYSWWGVRQQQNNTTARFPVYLRAAHGTPFKWAVYYETEGYSNPDVAQIRSDLAFIKARPIRATCGSAAASSSSCTAASATAARLRSAGSRPTRSART